MPDNEDKLVYDQREVDWIEQKEKQKAADIGDTFTRSVKSTEPYKAHAGEVKTLKDPPQSSIDSLLQDRGKQYGKFNTHAALTQMLEQVFYQHVMRYNKAVKFTASQREAIHMIFHKLGRIGNGNPGFAESWRDIAGYAELVAKECEF